MNSSAKKSCNFSNQKTPNGHPNTFLYRAHINLNELGSSVNQEDYSGIQANQGNVSSFYNDDHEERKGDLRLSQKKERDGIFQMGSDIEM